MNIDPYESSIWDIGALNYEDNYEDTLIAAFDRRILKMIRNKNEKRTKSN